MHPILAAFHRYKMKLTLREGAGIIHGGRSLPVWIQDSVGFHGSNQVAAFLPAFVQDVRVGVPAVHKDICSGLVRQGVDYIQSHLDFCAAFLAVTLQGITQGGFPSTDNSGMNLIAVDYLSFQMRVMPASSFCGPFRFR